MIGAKCPKSLERRARSALLFQFLYIYIQLKYANQFKRETTTLNNQFLKLRKLIYISYLIRQRFQSTVVNRTLSCFHEGLLKITLTVPLNRFYLRKSSISRIKCKYLMSVFDLSSCSQFSNQVESYDYIMSFNIFSERSL